MKCETTLARLETGTACQHLLARLHLGRCSDCRAAHRNFVALKRELSRGDQPTDADRRAWLAKAGPIPADRASPAIRPAIWWIPVGTAVGLTALASIGFWFLPPRSPDDPPGPTSHSGIHSVQQISGHRVWSELSSVRVRIGDMSEELEQLAVQAGLLDEERRVDELLAHYSRYEGSNQ